MTLEREIIGTTANGVTVYTPKSGSLKAFNIPEDLLKEALSKVSFKVDYERHIVDMGRIVGTTNCVKTTKEDIITLEDRDSHSGRKIRMVKNREPEPCKFVTIILNTSEDGFVVVNTAYVGGPTEAEPWNKNHRFKPGELERAIEFWATHAYIYDPTLIKNN